MTPTTSNSSAKQSHRAQKNTIFHVLWPGCSIRMRWLQKQGCWLRGHLSKLPQIQERYALTMRVSKRLAVRIKNGAFDWSLERFDILDIGQCLIDNLIDKKSVTFCLQTSSSTSKANHPAEMAKGVQELTLAPSGWSTKLISKLRLKVPCRTAFVDASPMTVPVLALM